MAAHTIAEVQQMYKASMSARGQVVIPVEIRRRLGLSTGSHFRIYDGGTRVILVPELADPIADGLGFLRRDADGEVPGMTRPGQ